MVGPFITPSAIALSFVSMLTAGCAGPASAPPAAPETGHGTANPVAPAASSPGASAGRQDAHRVVIAAAGCWSGGTWSDALGEQDLMKQKGIDSRCHELERLVWPGAEDKTHYEQLRALETNAVGDVVAKVDETARAEGVDGATRQALVKLTNALAEEEKELLLARRAADRMKRDLDHEPERLTADEVAAVQPLRSHAKLEALLSLNAGGLSSEAHALGLVRALDRVEIARGLPKHLKLYAVADVFHLLFGVTVPDVSQDATRKLVPGTWLNFLCDTARLAGYPVGDQVTAPKERDALAWAGMLHGFSDRLKADEDAISPSTDLANVVAVAVHRLEAEYGAQKAAEATLHPPKIKDR